MLISVQGCLCSKVFTNSGFNFFIQLVSTSWILILFIRFATEPGGQKFRLGMNPKREVLNPEPWSPLALPEAGKPLNGYIGYRQGIINGKEAKRG